jgi:arrestin-related trafficking adapter 1
MPTRARPSLHFGKSNSPHHSTTTLNEAVSAVQRKLTLAHKEEVPAVRSSPRRQSFSMNAILHPGKEKDHHHHGRSDSKDREARKNKRNSLTSGLRSSSKTKDARATHSPRLAAVSPAKFDMIIESPPLIFYGTTENSTGALLSGRLKLDVTDPAGEVTLTKLVMAMNAAITTKKPVAKDCPECTKRVNDLKTWNFLSEPKTFYLDKNNQFPFSFLLPGHLPATTISSLGSVTYYLEAKATTSHSEEIYLTLPLKIERAVPPGLEKSSIRIFPPTNLTSRLIMPPVIHPIGNFPLQMILSGVVDKKAETQTRWRLRKVLWRIEEHTKIISPPCSKHGHKVGGDGKALQHQDERTVGSDELKAGWKSDFDTQGGEITLEFDARLSPSKHPICDMDSPAGLEVKHNLVIELIIAEEFCPNRNTSLITPTGAARVLRMQFGISVTERAGMGISWDEEMPPVYEDVPASPPGYGRSDGFEGVLSSAIMEDYEGPELEYVDLERLHSDNPSDPPTYRERDPNEYSDVMVAMMRGSGSGPGSGVGSTASPGLGPSSPRARARTGSSNHSVHGLQRPVHPRFTEDDFVIEPPQFRIASDESPREVVEEDFGEGETR